MNNALVMTIPSKLVEKSFNERRFYHGDEHIDRFEELVHGNARFIDRELAEKSAKFRQIVSCAVVWHEDKVLCLRRTKKSNRKELKLRWTIMIGGHVDEGDRLAADPLKNCVLRELKEEIGVEPVCEPRILGLVVDPANPAGRLHLGVIYSAEFDDDEIVVSQKFDNKEFVNSKRRNIYKMYGKRDLIDISNKFDPWTSLFLESDLALTMLRAELPIVGRSQKEFSFKWS